jgi:hypothetical protein
MAALGRGLGALGTASVLALAVGCGADGPASLSVRVRIASSERTCTPGTTMGSFCQLTSILHVSIQETAGREVSLESVTGVLWDTRGMQNMHAMPASLSSADIRTAAGSSTIPGHSGVDVPYTLAFTFVEPYILGPVQARVHVRGWDSDGNVIEADAEST